MKRTITDIIIHCAATPNGKDISIEQLDAMHKERGFKRDSQARRNFNPTLTSVGYHFVITVDGVVHTGRGLEEIGAHVQGNNSHSIGICMIGTDKFTKAQWDALRNLLISLAGQIIGRPMLQVEKALSAYKDMNISIKGHRDYSPDLNGNGLIERTEWLKICPGFSVAEFLKGGMVNLPNATL